MDKNKCSISLWRRLAIAISGESDDAPSKPRPAPVLHRLPDLREFGPKFR